MPVKSDPTMGWRRRDVAEIILLVTAKQKREQGERVARLRDQMGMTNESLARKSKLSVKTVSRFVNGKHEAREHTIESLAKALRTTPAEIRGTPPAPLGLGAREDQVADIRAEFREHVRKMDSKLDKILEKLAVADMASELEAIAGPEEPDAGTPEEPSQSEDDQDSEETG